MFFFKINLKYIGVTKLRENKKMLKMLVKWMLFALALLFVAYIIPGISIAGFITALFATLIIGFINVFIKPIMLALTLPISILTLGLFTLIINAVLFSFTAYLVPGFTVSGFMPALVGSILFSILSMIINSTGRAVPA